VIICALCDVLSNVAEEVHQILVGGSHCFGRDWNKQYRMIGSEININCYYSEHLLTRHLIKINCKGALQSRNVRNRW